MPALAILTTLTETLTGLGMAVPVIFQIVRTMRTKIDPTITDAQLIDLMDQAFALNHSRNQQQVAELRGTI